MAIKTYLFGAVLIHRWYSPGGEVISEEGPNESTPGQPARGHRIPSPPKRISTIIDVCSPGPQSTTIRLSLVLRLVLESLPVQLRRELGDDANGVQPESKHQCRTRRNHVRDRSRLRRHLRRGTCDSPYAKFGVSIAPSRQRTWVMK